MGKIQRAFLANHCSPKSHRTILKSESIWQKLFHIYSIKLTWTSCIIPLKWGTFSNLTSVCRASRKLRPSPAERSADSTSLLFLCTSLFVFSEAMVSLSLVWAGKPPKYKTCASRGPLAPIVLRKYSVPFIFTWTRVTFRTTWNEDRRSVNLLSNNFK